MTEPHALSAFEQADLLAENEELQAQVAQLQAQLADSQDAKRCLNALIEIKRQAETQRVWNGQGYTYNPLPRFIVERILATIDTAMEENEDA